MKEYLKVITKEHLGKKVEIYENNNFKETGIIDHLTDCDKYFSISGTKHYDRTSYMNPRIESYTVQFKLFTKPVIEIW